MSDKIIKAMTQLDKTHSKEDSFKYKLVFVEREGGGKPTNEIPTEEIKSMIIVTSEGERQINPDNLTILCVLKDEDNKNTNTEIE